jgi:hypothetical protein
LNNQKQLAFAMFSFANKGTNGAYPGWADNVKLAGGATLAAPWTFKLLPEIEQGTLREQILANDATLNNILTDIPRIATFICPSDAGTNADLGTLTYVVNAGMPDPAHPLPRGFATSDLKANGVCHDQRPGREGPSVKVTDVTDGTATTFLMAENVHKDVQVGGVNSTWIGKLQNSPLNPSNTTPAALSAASDISSNPEQRFGMVWPLPDFSTAPGPPNISDFEPINKDTLGGNYSGAGTRFARPSSEHPEIFIAGFCQGNAREIRENIEFRVYQQLMTPQGMKAAYANTPNDHLDKELPANKRFMNPPLSDSDY